MSGILLLAVSCKKNPPLQPQPLPAVVLGGAFWTLDEDGVMNYLSDAPLGQSVLAYPNKGRQAKDMLVETRLHCSNTSDSDLRNYVHISAGEADRADLWVQEDSLVLQALPVLLVDAMPFAPVIKEDWSQFAESQHLIPAHTIIALHDRDVSLDCLKVSYLDSSEGQKPQIRTGFIPNPHPFLSTAGDDIAAIRLYREAILLPEEKKDAKKSLLDSALALEGLSPKVRAMILAEQKKLTPPKVNVSYERVRIPPILKGASKSRYSVNMGELLKGGTEDPWAKEK